MGKVQMDNSITLLKAVSIELITKMTLANKEF
jgi:hypothetical protein